MRAPILSERMKAITEMVTPGVSVCDVGCDHGYVSIYLVKEKGAPKAIAMDVRPGPLSLAREHVSAYGVSDKVECRLSDGLENVAPKEAQCLVIAGMGGNLMCSILKEGEEKAKSFRELILQPQSQIEEFRIFLREHGYKIVAEDMVLEEGKYYPLMKAIPYIGTVGEACEDREIFDRYGEYLLRNRNPVLKQYLLRTYENNEDILKHLDNYEGDRIDNRRESIGKEQDGIRKALAKYYL